MHDFDDRSIARGDDFMLIKQLIEDNLNVYEHMQDDLSKFIFSQRILFSLTGNLDYINNITCLLPEQKELKRLEGTGENYIFGAGMYGEYIYHTINHKWQGFIDNDKMLWENKKFGLPIIAPADIPRGARVFIASKFYTKSIKEQLEKFGFKDDQIFDCSSELIKLSNQKQYFDLPDLYCVEDEVFADVGSFDGNSALCFAKWTKDKYKHIYSFEPDMNNITRVNESLATLIANNRATVIKKGLWSETAELSFVAEGTINSCIGKGENKIHVVSLDTLDFADEITFIKMDIEGAEKRAIEGAKEILRNHKPKLAICIYHKPEDVFEIPQLILKYQPNYKFYIRHYTLGPSDTVLYAI